MSLTRLIELWSDAVLYLLDVVRTHEVAVHGAHHRCQPQTISRSVR